MTDYAALLIFFTLGLIAGGLLCRRGPMGPTGCDGAPGIQGPRGLKGEDGKNSEDYDLEQQFSYRYNTVTGPQNPRSTLHELLLGLHNKVNQLRRHAQQETNERNACKVVRNPNDNAS